MPASSRLSIAIKALRQLGFTQVALNALYRLGMKTGYFKRVERGRAENRRAESRGIENRGLVTTHLLTNHLFSFPSRAQILQTIEADGLQSLLTEADEIVVGRFRQFGGEPVDLNLAPAAPLAHWTAYETGQAPTLYSLLSDLKLHWEPARFGWAFILGRAYHVSADEKYAEVFWRDFESFSAGNPPYLGPNWMSGQEVGIRLMAFAWAAQAFSGSPSSTPARRAALAGSVAIHAARIPATLLYARSQNNNHLLTEAAALYTAGLALPEHPQAAKWRKLGQKWLAWCFTHQIDAYGEYVQHSTNYHRLMLQTALWVRALESRDSRIESGQSQSMVYRPSSTVQENLALATHWQLSLLDPESGLVPNLGANDGALIFPLSSCDFSDYRPVAQAAARAFLGHSLSPGTWDEMSLWFDVQGSRNALEAPRYPGDNIYAPNSWGYLRAVKFKSRPSHADQLHFDLWWRGLNIAQDAGTYLYNADPPWDNRLAGTLVHNTVSVDGREQMTRAGRFLYLDWAEAGSRRHFETGADYLQRISAWTQAYSRLGVRHERSVTVYNDERWQVEDELRSTLPRGKEPRSHVYRLHWLLPDWEWGLENRDERVEIRFKSPHGWVTLSISAGVPPERISLVRAGEYLRGTGAPDPVRGWVSPTYARKVPALSLAVEVESTENVKLISEFIFPALDGLSSTVYRPSSTV